MGKNAAPLLYLFPFVSEVWPGRYVKRCRRFSWRSCLPGVTFPDHRVDTVMGKDSKQAGAGVTSFASGGSQCSAVVLLYIHHCAPKTIISVKDDSDGAGPASLSVNRNDQDLIAKTLLDEII